MRRLKSSSIPICSNQLKSMTNVDSTALVLRYLILAANMLSSPASDEDDDEGGDGVGSGGGCREVEAPLVLERVNLNIFRFLFGLVAVGKSRVRLVTGLGEFCFGWCSDWISGVTQFSQIRTVSSKLRSANSGFRPVRGSGLLGSVPGHRVRITPKFGF